MTWSLGQGSCIRAYWWRWEGGGARGGVLKLLMKCIIIQPIDCYCNKGLKYCFALSLLFFIYSGMGLLIQCRVSDTQVTVKAHWPLFWRYIYSSFSSCVILCFDMNQYDIMTALLLFLRKIHIFSKLKTSSVFY